MRVLGRDGGTNVVELEDGSRELWTDEELAEKQAAGHVADLLKIEANTRAVAEIQAERLGGGEKAMEAPPENKAVKAPPAKKRK
jgi:hypothetical protein